MKIAQVCRPANLERRQPQNLRPRFASEGDPCERHAEGTDDDSALHHRPPTSSAVRNLRLTAAASGTATASEYSLQCIEKRKNLQKSQITDRHDCALC
jgi:hypothetical protein